MSPSVRRTALQPTAGYSTPENKKPENQALNKTKLIAGGIILGLAIATAAYCAHSYYSVKPKFDFKRFTCDLAIIKDASRGKPKLDTWGRTPAKGELYEYLPGSPEYSKAYSDLLNGQEYKDCLSGTMTPDYQSLNDFLNKFCEAGVDKTNFPNSVCGLN